MFFSSVFPALLEDPFLPSHHMPGLLRSKQCAIPTIMTRDTNDCRGPSVIAKLEAVVVARPHMGLSDPIEQLESGMTKLKQQLHTDTAHFNGPSVKRLVENLRLSAN